MGYLIKELLKIGFLLTFALAIVWIGVIDTAAYLEPAFWIGAIIEVVLAYQTVVLLLERKRLVALIGIIGIGLPLVLSSYFASAIIGSVVFVYIACVLLIIDIKYFREVVDVYKRSR